ncbi:Cytochrome P450 [Geosmithia morbida]|uniref:Cytochrome P450 n=1 Tax=Geosmithia morbida TaxID=1094350 RepID=A0A9P4YX02_9HYPO|nr:Cytochrome P450 [Geosmithia morbida]KAF4123266.1 Cytochrome P450 [Geosmithia morbida]
MLITSPLFLAVTALLAVTIFLVRRLSSPLWKLPGPTISRFTSLELRWNEIKANRTMYIHSLHLRFGPVVRVSPHEVSFTSWPALKEIYTSGGSGYDKSEFYNLFTVFGRRTMFSTLVKADHTKRKRLLADRYANTNIMRGPAIAGIQERSSIFLHRCTSAGTRAHDVFVNRLISYYSPRLYNLVSGIIYLFAKSRDISLASTYVTQTSQATDPATFTLMGRLMGEKGGSLDSTTAAAECLDHMVAGIDTTGDGLCFLMWELSQPRNASIQRRLCEELRTAPSDVPLDQLPFLDAVVNEGLRCFPPIPMSLPRVVPGPGGRAIDGLWLPQGTVVSCQSYSVHRLNQDAFPEPQRFNPDRWLAADGDTERRRLMFSFSNGGRGCVGKHLALAEMKTLLSDVYSSYSTTPHVSMTEDDMIMSDQLISSQPKGRRCLLHFNKLDPLQATA